MQVKFGTLVVVCLVLDLLAGNAAACDQGTNDHYCEHGAQLDGWGVADGSCYWLREYIPYPDGCIGCTIHTEIGYIEVWTPEGGSYRCDYGNDIDMKACEAWCLDTEGYTVHGSYECFVANDSVEPCGCERDCIDLN